MNRQRFADVFLTWMCVSVVYIVVKVAMFGYELTPVLIISPIFGAVCAAAVTVLFSSKNAAG